ncbi:MAG: hypothetical protein ABF274_12535 [Nonlabens sp.]|uniref:hypothetical protein n=1 Tax=Nonlabens sp. TaxID=1888209 RepID=UPI00321BBA8F
MYRLIIIFAFLQNLAFAQNEIIIHDSISSSVRLNLCDAKDYFDYTIKKPNSSINKFKFEIFQFQITFERFISKEEFSKLELLDVSKLVNKEPFELHKWFSNQDITFKLVIKNKFPHQFKKTPIDKEYMLTKVRYMGTRFSNSF